MIRNLWCFLCLLLLVQEANAQEILTEDRFIQLVLDNHPKSRQAQLELTKADFAWRAAKGAFDPKLEADYRAKQFDGKNYYSVGASELKLPTRFGLDLKGGFNWADGIFLNPEQNVPSAGQAFLGVELPLLNGLWIDPERTELRKAEVGLDQADAQRRFLQNNLLVKAVEAYWEWDFAARNQALNEEALQLTRQRFEGIRESFIVGDKPAVDTLEAWIQVQNRQFDLREAENQLQQQGLLLQNFIWPDGRAVIGPINQNWQPAVTDELPSLPGLDQLQDSLSLRQPDLQNLFFYQELLELDRRLQKEQLKPTLNLKYQLLADGWQWGELGGSNIPSEALLWNNYAFGVQFSYPLLQRKDRNKLRLIEVKQQELAFKLLEIQQSWRVIVAQFYEQSLYLDEQITLYQQIVKNYKSLLDAEVTRFQLGDSSVFLVNAREQKWLDARRKLLKLEVDFRKNWVKLRWAAGIIGL